MMGQNLDVIISFVVIIAGLSMMLQIVMEAVKNFLKLRWSVYEKYLVSIYKNYFIEGIDRVEGDKALWARIKKEIKASRPDNEPGSLGDRFVNFNRQAAMLAKALGSVRGGLLKLQKETEEKDNEEFLKIVRQKILNSEIEEIKQAVNRVCAIDLGRLLGVYLKVHNNVAAALRSQQDSHKNGETSIDETSKNLENITQDINGFSSRINSVKAFIADLEKESQQALEKTTDDTVNKLREALKDVVVELIHHEQLIAGFRDKIEVNIDNWRGELEKKYTKNITLWSFGVGFILVVILNADTFNIYRALSQDSSLRNSVIEQSANLVEQVNIKSRSDEINALNRQVNSLVDAHEKIIVKKLDLFINDFENLGKVLSEEADHIARLLENGEGAIPQIKFDKTMAPIQDIKKIRNQGDGEVPDNRTKDVLNKVDLAMSSMVHNYVHLNTQLIKAQADVLVATNVPLGWDREKFNAMFESGLVANIINFIIKALSFLLTAVLISFGSSFWNELLKSLLGLKGYMRNKQLKV